MNSNDFDRGRRRLQWALATSAALPTLTGVREVLLGSHGAPGGPGDVSATIDGELRYANVFKMAVGPVIWSQLNKAESSPWVTAALGTIFLGGAARLLSWQQRGKPHPISVVAIGIEIGLVPVLIVWQRRVAVRLR